MPYVALPRFAALTFITKLAKHFLIKYAIDGRIILKYILKK
jgi:hypothetical protein